MVIPAVPPPRPLGRRGGGLALVPRLLAQLMPGEEVIVYLHPESDAEAAFVHFDHPRVMRILAGMAADLDEIARHPRDAPEAGAKDGDIVVGVEDIIVCRP